MSGEPAELGGLVARHAPKPPAGLVPARLLPGGEVELASAGPQDADAVFELGSITKAVTGLLLAGAAVRGEVGLDTPATAEAVALALTRRAGR